MGTCLAAANTKVLTAWKHSHVEYDTKRLAHVEEEAEKVEDVLKLRRLSLSSFDGANGNVDESGGALGMSSQGTNERARRGRREVAAGGQPHTLQQAGKIPDSMESSGKPCPSRP
jgi:hypothetical protein